MCLQSPVFPRGPFSSPLPAGLCSTGKSLGTKVVAASHLGRTGHGSKVWPVPGLKPPSPPPQLTVEKLISKGRVLTMANQILAVNISEEVSSTGMDQWRGW